MIYNLPYVQFPEGIATGVGDYDEMRPYLHTHHVRYSYGAMRGRGANEWENRVLGAGPNLAPALKRLGFSAILIDNNYCDQSESTRAQIAQIVKQCHATPTVSPDDSFVFIPIR